MTIFSGKTVLIRRETLTASSSAAVDSLAAEGKYLGVKETVISVCFLGPLVSHAGLSFLSSLLGFPEFSFLPSVRGFARLCLIFSNLRARSSASDDCALLSAAELRVGCDFSETGGVQTLLSVGMISTFPSTISASSEKMLDLFLMLRCKGTFIERLNSSDYEIKEFDNLTIKIRHQRHK